MANTQHTEPFDHLANEEEKDYTNNYSEVSDNNGFCLEPGTAVLLTDGRKGTVTYAWKGQQVGIYMFNSEETVYAYPEELTAIYTAKQ